MLQARSMLYWWIFAIIHIGMIYLGFEFDIFQTIHEYDYTNISFGIMFLYTLSFLYIPYLIKNKALIPENMNFVSSLLVRLGLIGTVVGLMFVLIEFGNVNPDDINNVKQLIPVVAKNMGVAFLTTLIGAISSFILDIQVRLMIEGYRVTRK